MHEAPTIHNPDRYMSDLRQVLSQGRKRIGLLIGAGAPTSIRVDNDHQLATNGSPLIPDVAGLTDTVLAEICKKDRQTVEILKKQIEKAGELVTIESILTLVRRLSQSIGESPVHDLNSADYSTLAQRICKEIGKTVSADLPASPNPYTELVSWISGTPRQHPVEIFTPNYDLLIEKAFERATVPYFDGFSGSHRPFFDAASVSSDEMPVRWSRLWKLHGSLGWTECDRTIVRTGNMTATELIYPDHLKYDRIRRLPYSALFDRLRQFLTSPDTLLICSGFSFLDSHISAVLDEALAANSHTAILAFQYRALGNETAAKILARSRPNLSVYAQDRAIISGIEGEWATTHHPDEERRAIRSTFWEPRANGVNGTFLLGNFAKLARFLALTQAQQFSSPAPEQTQSMEYPQTHAAVPGAIDA